MASIEIEIISSSDTKKHYVFRIKKSPCALFRFLFAAEKEQIRVKLLSKKEIEADELQEISEEILENKFLWVKEGKKGAKSCDFKYSTPNYPQTTFFIYNETCSNETDKNA